MRTHIIRLYGESTNYYPSIEAGHFAYAKKRRRSSALIADQRLCFRYIDSTISLLHYIGNYKHVVIFCGCTAHLCRTWSETEKTGFLRMQAAHICPHTVYLITYFTCNGTEDFTGVLPIFLQQLRRDSLL